MWQRQCAWPPAHGFGLAHFRRRQRTLQKIITRDQNTFFITQCISSANTSNHYTDKFSNKQLKRDKLFHQFLPPICSPSFSINFLSIFNGFSHQFFINFRRIFPSIFPLLFPPIFVMIFSPIFHPFFYWFVHRFLSDPGVPGVWSMGRL